MNIPVEKIMEYTGIASQIICPIIGLIIASYNIINDYKCKRLTFASVLSNLVVFILFSTFAVFAANEIIWSCVVPFILIIIALSPAIAIYYFINEYKNKKRWKQYQLPMQINESSLHIHNNYVCGKLQDGTSFDIELNKYIKNKLWLRDHNIFENNNPNTTVVPSDKREQILEIFSSGKRTTIIDQRSIGDK